MNPWRLQTWLGHKRNDEAMLHVHVAGSHGASGPKQCTRLHRSKRAASGQLLLAESETTQWNLDASTEPLQRRHEMFAQRIRQRI